VILDRLPPVETTLHDRTEVPPPLHPSRSVAFIALNHESRDVHYTQSMAHHEEEDIAKATRAVCTACDDVEAFRASRHLQIPSSLPDIVIALDQLCANLSVLADSTKALSIFRACTLREESDSVETPLSDAIIHDMEAAATYFKAMTPEGSIELPVTLSEQECQKVKEMVHRYESIVSTMLSKHKECVQDEFTGCVCLLLIHTRLRLSSLTADGREIREGVDVIKQRLSQQQESELADLRTSESLSTPVNVSLALTPSQRGL
jgi:hypothetical protein